MSFFSDWQAAVNGTLDPVSGKPAAVHGKDVSPVHGGDDHNVHATNHPQNRTAVTSEPPAPKPAPKKRNRWGDE